MDRNYIIEILVGVMMLLGILAFATLTLRTTGITLGGLNQREHYNLYVSFDDIGGLTERSKVTIAGVRVGRVTAIGIDSQTQQGWVELSIARDIDFLTTDTQASIKTSGLLGEQYIELLSGADEELLTDGGEIIYAQSALDLSNIISTFTQGSGRN